MILLPGCAKAVPHAGMGARPNEAHGYLCSLTATRPYADGGGVIVCDCPCHLVEERRRALDRLVTNGPDAEDRAMARARLLSAFSTVYLSKEGRDALREAFRLYEIAHS